MTPEYLIESLRLANRAYEGGETGSLLSQAADMIARQTGMLEIVQNFQAHPGAHPEDHSSGAEDAPSYRQGWIDAVHAMLNRVNTPIQEGDGR